APRPNRTLGPTQILAAEIACLAQPNRECGEALCRARHAVQRQQQRPDRLQRARDGEGTECQLSDRHALAATPSRPRLHRLHEKGRLLTKSSTQRQGMASDRVCQPHATGTCDQRFHEVAAGRVRRLCCAKIQNTVIEKEACVSTRETARLSWWKGEREKSL